MLVAARGFPAAGVAAATIGGGALCAGAAATFNGLYDRDIDRVMQRTQRRPLPGDQLSVRTGWIWGSVLFATSITVLWIGVGPISAGLAAAAFVIYVGIYTLGLKRRSPQNIVIGGAAGAFPPVIGWAAATGGIGVEALVLFAIVFVWTPPHFWALALYRAGDYARAGVPMLPVVAGRRETKRQILLYSVLLLAVSLAPYALGFAGVVYAAAAAVLGLAFLAAAIDVGRGEGDRAARRLFGYSILYLFALFAILAVDSVAGTGA